MNNLAPDGLTNSTLASVAPIRIAPANLSPETVAILRKHRADEARQARTRHWVRIERAILLPILALVIVGLFNFKVGQVEGRSMAPQFATGDHLLLLKSYARFSPVKIGDIVVIKLHHGKYAGEEWVKRVVYIQNDQGNAKWPDFVRTSRGEVPVKYFFPAYILFRKQVPADGLLVMGDNRMNSIDSRDDDIGPISPDEIEGKVIKYWPGPNNLTTAAL